MLAGRNRLTLVLAVAVMFMAAGNAPAQVELRRGLVVDETGAALPGVRLVLRSAQGAFLHETATGADGAFGVGAVPPGTYWLDVDAPSFRPRRMTMQVSERALEPARIVLGLAPFQNDVTVTASRGLAADVDAAAAIVTIEDREDLRARPLVTIADVFEGAPGVMVQQSTHGQASPFLRGLTGYQVLNLVDGVRLNNTIFRSGPNQYLAFVAPSQVSRIEAMLGPASAQFGSDAMGGAIHVLTPIADFSTASRVRVSGGLDLFGATADVGRGATASMFVRGRRLSGVAGLSRRTLGELRSGGGRDSRHVLVRLFGLSAEQVAGVTGERQRGTGFTQSGGHAKVAGQVGSEHHLVAWYQRSTQTGVRGYKDLWGGLGRLQSSFTPQTLQLAYGRAETLRAGPLDWLSATVSVNAQRDGTVRQNLLPTDVVVRDDVGVDVVGYAAQGGAHLGTRHAIVFGGEVYDERVAARRDESSPATNLTVQKRALYPNGSRYVTTGLFVQDQIDLLRHDGGRGLTARAGGRFTRVDVRMRAADNVGANGQPLGVVDAASSYQDWTFNAGLTWTIHPAFTLHGTVGRGFRAPNLNDLGALGLNDLGYEVPAAAVIESGALVGAGDGEGVLSTGRTAAALSAERLMNYELGVTVSSERAYLRVQGFDAELGSPIVRRTMVFPADRVPTALGGVAVAAIAPTSAQREQGVVSVATAMDPRAIKAFVNDGRARYYGVDALARYRLARRWSAEANYSYLVGHDLDPQRPVRRLPPQQGRLVVRYQPGGLLSWVDATLLAAGRQSRLSGGDLTDERIGAARRRSDITDFFRGGLVRPYLAAGPDGRVGTDDDVFAPTGETVAAIRDRVLPLGATINGVTVVNDATRVPLYTSTSGYASLSLRAGLSLARHLDATVAVMNLFDRNYRVHGSGVDAPGRSLFATVSVSF